MIVLITTKNAFHLLCSIKIALYQFQFLINYKKFSVSNIHQNFLIAKLKIFTYLNVNQKYIHIYTVKNFTVY